MRPGALFGLSIVLSFVAWGIVAARCLWPALPAGFAVPAAYRDLIAAILALLALAGGRLGIGVEPGQLGAAYFIPTVVVPLLLITHGLAFRLLLQRRGVGRSV